MTSTLGVHLVGSICSAPTATSAFHKCTTAFPSRLRRIPDGEPASRSQFIAWQMKVFEYTPAVMRQYDNTFSTIPQLTLPASKVDEIVKNMPPLKPGYADAAIESYAVFRRLGDEGVIEKGVRFQASLPTVMAIISLIRDGFQAAVEPVYEKALLNEVNRIRNEIPNEDLAIQGDVANEICTLEEAYWPHFVPYFEPVWEGIVERIRLTEQVVLGVEVGFHFCYGDMGNKHFVEPKDLGFVVKLVEKLLEGMGREVNWIHVPVPKGRDDVEYFSVLAELDLGETELYLGLVHANDEEGPGEG